MKTTAIILGKFLFKIRGITPVPFYFVCLLYCRIELKFFLPGLLLIGLGEILRFFSVGYLGISSRRTDNADTDNLVISGPYRFVRNPIYLGNISIYLGFAVLSNVFFPIYPAIVLVFFTLIYYCIIKYEEKVLKVQFGRNYEYFFMSVPRFVPLWSPLIQTTNNQKFNYKKALQSERATFTVLVFTFISIIIKNYTHFWNFS